MDSQTGLFVFIGVLLVLIFVIIGSYLTDYIVQPAPPAKVFFPIGALHAPTVLHSNHAPTMSLSLPQPISPDITAENNINANSLPNRAIGQSTHLTHTYNDPLAGGVGVNSSSTHHHAMISSDNTNVEVKLNHTVAHPLANNATPVVYTYDLGRRSILPSTRLQCTPQQSQ
uniref:Uncharacterized protein n=1 Tax=Lygus hesperus TaxID=30085 RepID=A0A146KR23_LYGHE